MPSKDFLCKIEPLCFALGKSVIITSSSVIFLIEALYELGRSKKSNGRLKNLRISLFLASSYNRMLYIKISINYILISILVFFYGDVLKLKTLLFIY